LQNPQEETGIDDICDESEERGLYLEELCKLREEDAKTKLKQDESFEASVEPDFQRNNNGDAWSQALQNIARGIGTIITEFPYLIHKIFGAFRHFLSDTFYNLCS
jgi:hypothetical protein